MLGLRGLSDGRPISGACCVAAMESESSMLGRVVLALVLVIAGNSGRVAHAHIAADTLHRHSEWPVGLGVGDGATRHTHLVCFGVDLGSLPAVPGESPQRSGAAWQSDDWTISGSGPTGVPAVWLNTAPEPAACPSAVRPSTVESRRFADFAGTARRIVLRV